MIAIPCLAHLLAKDTLIKCYLVTHHNKTRLSATKNQPYVYFIIKCTYLLQTIQYMLDIKLRSRFRLIIQSCIHQQFSTHIQSNIIFLTSYFTIFLLKSYDYKSLQHPNGTSHHLYNLFIFIYF